MIRFELVRGNDSAQPWHARIKAGNSRTWFVSETYTRKASAHKAATNLIIGLVDPDSVVVTAHGVLLVVNGQDRLIEVLEVDERATP